MKTAMITPVRFQRALAESVPVVESQRQTLSKETNAEYQKRARRGMLGFTVSWLDLNPFDDNATIAGGEITHDNPTQKLICVDMWRKCSHWIVNTEFTWLVRMSVIFQTEKRGDALVEYEFTYTGTLRGSKSEILNDKMQECFKDAHAANESYPEGHKNKGVYLQTEFVAKVVGV